MPQSSHKESLFENYADTHPMGGPVSDFEKSFYQKYLNGFSGSVLDIGCGDGKYVQFLYDQLGKQNQIVPCDISYKRIKRVFQNGYGGIVGSADFLPLKDKSFDMVFLMQVIEHVPQPGMVISECKRVLKAGGYCFVLTPNYPAKRFYDWMEVIRRCKWKKIFDDPTHCSKFSARKLDLLLRQHFKRTEIFPTFVLGEKIRQIKHWKNKRNSSMFFCHKLLAVCQN